MAIRLFRWLAVLLAACLLFLVIPLAWLWLAALQPPDHLARKGQLVAVEPLSRYRLPNGEVHELRLFSTSGLMVDIAIRRPDTLLVHRPMLLLMGGQETGRAAVDVIPDSHGAIVAAISYTFGVVPHRNLWQVFLALPRIQQGIFDTPAAALLSLDYLLSEDAGIHPGRVELAGISFGAYLAAIPAVLDARVERLWLIHGGGAPAEVFDHGLSQRIPLRPLRRAVAGYLAAVVGAAHLGPEAWVYRLSPRPLVLVHASGETFLPPAAIAALEATAREPVEYLYTEGKHVHPRRPEVIGAITELMFDRIRCPAAALAC